MNKDDLFTAESIALFAQRTNESAQTGQSFFDQYRQDRAAQIADAPELRTWIEALEDGDLAAATKETLPGVQVVQLESWRDCVRLYRERM